MLQKVKSRQQYIKDLISIHCYYHYYISHLLLLLFKIGLKESNNINSLYVDRTKARRQLHGLRIISSEATRQLVPLDISSLGSFQLVNSNSCSPLIGPHNVPRLALVRQPGLSSKEGSWSGWQRTDIITITGYVQRHFIRTRYTQTGRHLEYVLQL